MPELLLNPRRLQSFRFLLPLLALLALPASAQETSPPDASPEATGFAVGARLSYGHPRGDARMDIPMAGRIDGVIAPQLDLSYFFTPNLAVELQGQYGVGRYSSLCTDEDCRGGVLRLGVGFGYHFPTATFWSPWVGAGVGYERLRTTSEGHVGKSVVTESGLELLNLQAGIDLVLADRVRVGPCFSGAVGMYFWSALRLNGQDIFSGSVEETTLHFWLQPGVRLQVRL
ncbi:outer membrane beta-barrel protein [Myxococcus sp. K15C18031901]|uniref:outer membrane beta-barrel protein n=1 Tax=Myxococcus dinghuensis TaxID=2906761 RepID=UPI0020A81EAD|nr:outer membrane beta-barrel protein [Myxococcus dinghuensis]MCP3103023.1 outer membrane beta-barrel protein [Myxococcus dinghuensis]